MFDRVSNVLLPTERTLEFSFETDVLFGCNTCDFIKLFLK